MAMIDALMMAYTVEMISIEKVVASVKRFSTFSASKELPYDLEDAMVFWINKVEFTSRCVSVPYGQFSIFSKSSDDCLSYLCFSIIFVINYSVSFLYF